MHAVKKYISENPFYIFFFVYLSSLSNNLSITHDSITYLSQVTSSQIILHPNHLIYQPFLVVVTKFFSYLGLRCEVYLIVEAVNAFLGALALQAAYSIMVKHLQISSQKAWIGLCAAGFTFGVWYYSVAIEIYILPLCFLTWSMYFLMEKNTSFKIVILASILHSIAILFHQTAILFAFVPVYALISLTDKDISQRFKLLGTYVLVGTLMVSSAYIMSAMYLDKLNSVADFSSWLLGYGTSSEYWSPKSFMALVLASVGFGRAMIGGHFVFGIPELQHKLTSIFSGNSLQDEIFLMQDTSTALLIILSLMSIFIVIAILAMIIIAGKNLTLGHAISPKRSVHLLFFWFVPYTLFFIVWDAANVDFWVVQALVFWILITTLLTNQMNRDKFPILLSMVAVSLFVVNGLGSLLPARDKTLDYYQVQVEKISKQIKPEDYLYLGDIWPLGGYLDHLTNINYSAISSIYKETESNSLVKEIKQRLENGQKVYFFHDVLSVSTVSKEGYGQGYVDYLKDLQDRFCNLKKLNSDIVISLSELKCID